MAVTKLSSKRKMRNTLFICFIIVICLIGRIGFIQFVQGGELSELAYQQQTLDRAINPKRGTIYDSSGKEVLAVSSTVETVTVNPGNIDKKDKEKVAKKLSELFELDYEKILKKVSKRSSIETIVKKVDREKTDQLRLWMQENNITTGINIDEDTKRYYPHSKLAAQIIGFCGSDNQGLDGIEAKYDTELKGKQGAIQRHTDAKGGEIGHEGENYVAAVDGNDLVLTIDLTIQSIVEKYLQEVCIDNKCTDGGNIVVMNPQNGDVLAMATYPSYDLNNPYEPYTDELKETWQSMDQSEIDKEGEFACTGGIEVAGVRIKCWRYYRPHGSESLRQGLMNSCNPVFIGLGQKLGVQKYYSYLNKFRLLDKTQIDLPGEANSIFLAENKARTC